MTSLKTAHEAIDALGKAPDAEKLKRAHMGLDRAVEEAYARGKRHQGPGDSEAGRGCESCAAALRHLNETAGRQYRGTPRTFAMLHQRVKDYGLANVLDTITHRWHAVHGTEWEWTMRPETLFNATKFDSYHAEVSPGQQAKKGDGWL